MNSWRQVPVITQAQRSECGLACIAMMAVYFGREVDLPGLRAYFDVGGTALTLNRLIEMGDRLGMRCRPLRAEPLQLLQIRKPCVLHWDMNHFVVLVRVSRSKAIIHDPALGRRSISIEELSRHFTGVVVEITEVASFAEKVTVPRLSMKSLLIATPGLNGTLTRIFVFALLLECLVVLSPLYIQTVLDKAIPTEDRQLLVLATVAFLLLIFFQGGIGALRSWLVAYAGVNISAIWNTNIFSHLLKLPQSYFDKRSLGDVTSRMSSVEQIQKVLTTRLIETVLDGLLAFFTLAVLISYSIPLALVTLGMTGLYAIFRVIAFPQFRDANLKSILAGANQQSLQLESIRSAQALRLYNLIPNQVMRYASKVTTAAKRVLDIQRLAIIFGTINFLVVGVQRILIISIGARYVMSGEFSIGMLVAFIAYNDQFAAKAGSLVDYGLEFRMIRLHLDRLSDVVLSAPEQNVVGKGVSLGDRFDISFDEVSFRYGIDDPWIIRSAGFSIEEGESVALVGVSGSGKSTVAKILLGLLDPTEGRVMVGGNDLRDYGKLEFRARVAAVLQEDQLLSGTIGENISLFDETCSLDMVQNAAIAAAIAPEIERMPLGYRTPVGDMGSTLSGGQKQRILLARALFRSPRLLILDEATSHLDVANEVLVNRAISQLKIARIIIAHRIETIRSADRIIELRDGVFHNITIDDGHSLTGC